MPTSPSDVAGEIGGLNADVLAGRDALRGQRVCVTGRLAAMSHQDLAALVRACGGHFQHHPLKGGFLLVIGADGWPAKGDGSPSLIFERARKLRAYGYPVEFLAEEEFFERIGFGARSAALGARQSIADLTRILGVSAARLRRWVRMGLIRPVEEVHRFCYFSFSEVASARRLCELVSGGAKLARIRDGLEQFRSWLPAAEVSFSQLALLERNGELLLRLNGALVEPSGQRRFDLDRLSDDGPQAVVMPHRGEDAAAPLDEFFDRGLALEDQGHFEEAAEAYRHAGELDPLDAAVHFNLGNVLCALGRLEEAIDRFRMALDCDPQYAEAWNNLGIARARNGNLPGAVQAFRRALELVPSYDDAAGNLARTLDELKPAHLKVVF
jgi:tetratricopeptide (TPR) repeat protein